MFSGICTTEIIIIAVIILILFGPKKLPEFMRGMGESFKEFKKAVKEEPEENNKES